MTHAAYIRRRVSAFTALILAASVSSGIARAQQIAATDQPCIADWSEAAPIVVRERLAPARHLQELARTRYSGDLVRITLCREDTRFVYRLLMRDDRGRISNLTVDARQPFAPAQPLPMAGSEDR